MNMSIEIVWLGILTLASIFVFVKLDRLAQSHPSQEEIWESRDRLTRLETKLDQVSASLAQLAEIVIRERS